MELHYGTCIFLNALGNEENEDDDALITMKLHNKKKVTFKASFYCEYAWNDLEDAGLVLFEVIDGYIVDFLGGI